MKEIIVPHAQIERYIKQNQMTTYATKNVKFWPSGQLREDSFMLYIC